MVVDPTKRRTRSSPGNPAATKAVQGSKSSSLTESRAVKMMTNGSFIVGALVLLVSTSTCLLSSAEPNVTIVLLHRRMGSDCPSMDAVNQTTVTATPAVARSTAQRETAARWASEIINNQTKPHLFNIGTR